MVTICNFEMFYYESNLLTDKMCNKMPRCRRKKSRNVVYHYIWRLLCYTNVNPLLSFCSHASQKWEVIFTYTSIGTSIFMNIKKFVVMPLVINVCNNIVYNNFEIGRRLDCLMSFSFNNVNVSDAR